jgi:multicomponent Na+:H+ antiporter subunit E
MRIFVRLLRGVLFILFYLKELVLSNLKVAYDVLTPTHQMKPGILEIPLDVTSDAEIQVFSNLMTMTPGTMTFALSDDRSKLYVHAMYIDDPKKMKKEIKENFEKKLLSILR